MILTDSMKKIMLAGIGAVAVTAEKSKDIIDELVTKGELTVEQGKVLNEELKHKLKETIKDNVQVQVIHTDSNQPPKAEAVLSHMEHYSPEELAAIRKKLEELAVKSSRPEAASSEPAASETTTSETKAPAATIEIQ